MDWQDLPPEAEDELLDSTIRRGLQRSLGSAQPSPLVWSRLRRQIEGGPAQARRRPAASPTSFAPLIQSLAALCLLLILGASLRWWNQVAPASLLERRSILVHGAPIGPVDASRPLPRSWADVEGGRPALQESVHRLPGPAAPQRPTEHAPRLVALDSRDDLVSLREVASISSARPAAVRASASPEINPAERLQPD